jgi:YD repeat-containing protein
VDTATGAFLHQTTDLAFGTLGWPIRFVRTYVSERKNAEGPLGYGWRHNYELGLTVTSDWARGLGWRTALDAVAAIAEAYVGLDLARAPVGGLSLARLVVGSASVHWATSQVTNNVVTMTDPDGAHRQYLRLPDGRYQPGHADYSSLVKNSDGSYTVHQKNGSRLEFNAQGRGTALVDANGNRTTLTYDGQSQLIKVTDAVGRAINLSYSGGRLTQIVDPAGRTFRYEYDAAGNLARYTDALSNTTRYGYDAQHRLTTLTDAEGITFTTNEYDAFDRVVRQVDGRGGTMTLRYGDVRAVMTDALGYRTVYFYDHNQWQVGMADPYGNRTTVVYDANDNVQQVSDRLGNVTS